MSHLSGTQGYQLLQTRPPRETQHLDPSLYEIAHLPGEARLVGHQPDGHQIEQEVEIRHARPVRQRQAARDQPGNAGSRQFVKGVCLWQGLGVHDDVGRGEGFRRGQIMVIRDDDGQAARAGQGDGGVLPYPGVARDEQTCPAGQGLVDGALRKSMALGSGREPGDDAQPRGRERLGQHGRGRDAVRVEISPDVHGIVPPGCRPNHADGPLRSGERLGRARDIAVRVQEGRCFGSALQAPSLEEPGQQSVAVRGCEKIRQNRRIRGQLPRSRHRQLRACVARDSIPRRGRAAQRGVRGPGAVVPMWQGCASGDSGGPL